MIIKQVSFQNINGVLDLIDEFDRKQSNRPNDDKISEIYTSLTQNSGCVLGAYLNNQIIGTCTINICQNFSWSGKSFAIIENVIVTESQRNKGVGKALLNFAKNYAIEHKCYKIILMTGSKKSKTLKFYESAGFIGDKTGFQIRFD